MRLCCAAGLKSSRALPPETCSCDAEVAVKNNQQEVFRVGSLGQTTEV